MKTTTRAQGFVRDVLAGEAKALRSVQVEPSVFEAIRLGLTSDVPEERELASMLLGAVLNELSHALRCEAAVWMRRGGGQ